MCILQKKIPKRKKLRDFQAKEIIRMWMFQAQFWNMLRISEARPKFTLYFKKKLRVP